MSGIPKFVGDGCQQGQGMHSVQSPLPHLQPRLFHEVLPRCILVRLEVQEPLPLILKEVCELVPPHVRQPMHTVIEAFLQDVQRELDLPEEAQHVFPGHVRCGWVVGKDS
jgi:hypothetical protein